MGIAGLMESCTVGTCFRLMQANTIDLDECSPRINLEPISICVDQRAVFKVLTYPIVDFFGVETDD